MYEVWTREGVVTARAKRRLPFQPRRDGGWEAAFRQKLRDELRVLPAGDGLLVAEFSQNSDEVFDLENVLFYNIGAAHFRHLSTQGLAFRRTAPSSRRHKFEDFSSSACSTYGIQKEVDWLRDLRPVADFALELSRLSADTKPHDVWWATNIIRYGDVVLGDYGLELAVTPPEGHRSNPANYIKPLLDGIICALQHDGTQDLASFDEVISRLVARLGAESADVTGRLQNESCVIKSTGPLVILRGLGLQWNPADHRCQAVIVRVMEPSDSAAFSIQGTLHTMET